MDRAALVARTVRIQLLAEWAVRMRTQSCAPESFDVTAFAKKVAKEACDLLSLLTAEPEDEPDITVGGVPWTDEQLAGMQAIALRADIRHARELLEANGYRVGAEPKRSKVWICRTCGKTLRNRHVCEPGAEPERRAPEGHPTRFCGCGYQMLALPAGGFMCAVCGQESPTHE
jgi:rubrerythrin